MVLAHHELPFRFPVLNSIAERWVMSVKEECLNKFIVFGLDHLDYIIREYVKYYNRFRPHQGKKNQTLESAEKKIVPIFQSQEDVYCQEYLGGVLKHYYSTEKKKVA